MNMSFGEIRIPSKVVLMKELIGLNKLFD